MLSGLSIRDVVLIERLDLAFGAGLNALTGETGAGKSILLDSLGLALGNRSEAGLVRQGAPQLSVSATFDVSGHKAVAAILDDQGYPRDDTLILRRVVSADGKSRAFVNDQASSLGLVKQLAMCLVETHGQFDTGALLDRETHRDTLDAFGRLETQASAVRAAWESWQSARDALNNAAAEQARVAAEETFLTDAVRHLDELNTRPGEDTDLEEKRQRLAFREKIAEAVLTAANELSGARGAETAINNARRALDRVAAQAGEALNPAQEALARAATELAEAADALSRVSDDEDRDNTTVEQIDDRLFALRAASRRHGVALADLPAFHEDLRRKLGSLTEGDNILARLGREDAAAKDVYRAAAARLTAGRTEAAKRLDKALTAELAPLKLDRARVVTQVEALTEPDWSVHGCNRVTFLVATNPGAAPGPLNKVASGGELSRFMLAMKVVLAGVSATPVMVFDEVDSGIGGATADAVGERLKRLGHELQVLVVTHSPQVAARADRQWRVEKCVTGKSVTTRIVPLDDTERREEIARMLSGATVTDEARAAAARLLAVA